MLEKFHLATRVISGEGCIREIPQEAARITSDKVMIVTDNGLIKAGMIDRITAVLSEKGIEPLVFGEVQPNPDVKIAARCAQIINDEKVGLVIAVGGGSSIDTAKAACMLATNGGDLRDYVGFERFRNNPVPLFAVPTTAGTGSEVTIVAVMSDEENNKKFTIGGQRLVPRIAFLDPELTLTLPKRITAYTGIDALSHAMESYTSINAQTITDSLNVTAIKLIFENLPTAALQGNNIIARKNMLNAACIASMTCNSTFLGLIHAIASPLCAYYNIPHGIAVAVVLPEVMRFNLPVCVDKFAYLADVLELTDRSAGKREKAEKTVEAVATLCEDVGIPKTLREIGVEKEKLDAIAEYAANYVQARTNARKASVADVRNILEQIY